MSTSGLRQNVQEVARYCAAELRMEAATQVTRIEMKYHTDYLERSSRRITTLERMNALLQEAAQLARTDL